MGFLGKLSNAISDFFNEQPDYSEYAQYQNNIPQQQPQEDLHEWDRPPEGVALLIGQTTGELARRGHPIGLAGGHPLWICNDDACQSIIAVGSIGSGKTTRIVNPILLQLLMYSDVGGLIFDVKGDFQESVDAFASRYDRKIHRIGVGSGCHTVNLLKGLSAEQASSFLSSTFYLVGGKTSDSFWIQSATALVKNTLGLLSYLGPEYYTLQKVYEYIFFEDIRKTLDGMLNLVELEEGSLEARNLANYQGYYKNVFEVLDVKTRESVKGELATVLAPFQSPELIDSFSGSHESDYELSNILKGDVVLVDLPLAKWSIAGKVIYTFIKLRFFNLVQERQVDKSLPQNYVFFLCDEYQELISASKDGALSDLNFFDKSRSAHAIGVFSTQSISAFKAAIGDPIISDTVLANFRQKIFLRTEDEQTLRYINSLAGRVEVERTGTTETEGDNYAIFHPSNMGMNASKSKNTNIVERQLVDANLVRQLSQNLALAFTNIEGDGCDDILILNPVYPQDYANGKDKCPQMLATPQYATEEQKCACNPSYHAQKTAEQEMQEAIDELDSMIGLDSVKHEVQTLINTLRVQAMRKQQGLSNATMSMHLVLTGNPGTGKTTVARLLSKIYHAMGILSKGHMLETTRADFIAEFHGQTAGHTRELVQKAVGGILFIDEAYSLVHDFNGHGDYGQEAVDELIKCMEDYRDDLIVIAAGYEREMDEFLNRNAGMKSRFPKKINFPDYTSDELAQVFNLYCKKNNYILDPNAMETLRAFFDRKAKDKSEPFANGRLARNLFEKSIQTQANRLSAYMNADKETLQTLTRQDIAEAAYQL